MRVVLVPAIDELSVLFDGDLVSVAEISVGQFLPLERWPEGELKLVSTVAGRQAAVYLNPSRHRIKVEIYAPDLVTELTLGNVSSVVADFKSHGVKALTIQVGETPLATVSLRLRPDIVLRFGNADSA